MTYIVGAFFLEFEDAYTWASRHAPDEMNLEDKGVLAGQIDLYFRRKGMPQRAYGIYVGEDPKILIITDKAVLSRKIAMKKFKYGEKARHTQQELFDPYKDELPFLRHPYFTTIKDPYEVEREL